MLRFLGGKEPPAGLVECVTPRERLETVTMSVC